LAIIATPQSSAAHEFAALLATAQANLCQRQHQSDAYGIRLCEDTSGGTMVRQCRKAIASTES